eukprot:CAMPEP_0115067792 /NCGR_PEP_ID=MMETSP0227-20121206/11602_1 /TAXON_ID=89957 /ORGANISM="Polarella glacialis, Strain CCMP 1383" /LENGTH=425 /DNA_ID=CAMNT_0002453929 /DNA_START=34 /DNA_END=1311 /DNA_ORIENTATION=+
MSSAEIKGIFQRYDRDGDGSISRNELATVLRALGTMQDSEIDTVFAHMDKNHDDKIQYEEFIDWFASESDPGAHALMAPQSGGMTLQDVFSSYCGKEPDMDGKTFAKLFKDCHLADKKLTGADVDMAFVKVCEKGRRRISLDQFQQALDIAAHKKGVSLSALEGMVMKSGGPKLNGTQADAVRFYDDKSTFTGTWANGGPEHVAKGVGSATVLASAGMKLGNGEHPQVSSRPVSARHTPLDAAGETGSSRQRSASPAPKVPLVPHAPTSPSPAARPHAQGVSGASSYQDVFQAFCGAHADLDGKSFSKLCKDCGLFDKHFTAPDCDLAFTKVVEKGQRRISLRQFEAAARIIADKKGSSAAAVLEAIAHAGGPKLSGTQADAVRFYDDKSTYTGTHVNGGPESVAVGNGSATALASQGMKAGFTR